jgi:hypothetical protein
MLDTPRLPAVKLIPQAGKTYLIGLVFVVALAISLRVWAWDGAVGFDGWAYTMWGQALADLRRPLYTAALTTPKPLAIILMAPFASFARPGFIVLVALLLGALIVILGRAAHDRWGWGGVGLAVPAFFVALPLTESFELSDATTALLVIAAATAGGRRRLAFLILAGLFRPEAWILAAAAGVLYAKGDRRLALAPIWGAGAAAAAPILWMGLDAILVGDPLATIRWTAFARDERVTAGGLPVEGSSPSEILGSFFDTFIERPALGIVLVLGTLGWLRARKHKEADFGALAPYLWCLGLAVGMVAGLELRERYLLPAVATWALGCGALTSRHRRRVGLATGAVGLIVAVLVAAVPDPQEDRTRAQVREQDTRASLPAIDATLRCGRIALAGSWRVRDAMPFVAGIGKYPPDRFFVVRKDASGALSDQIDAAGIIRVHAVAGRLPRWPRFVLPLGRLAVEPGCPYDGEGYRRLPPRSAT